MVPGDTFRGVVGTVDQLQHCRHARLIARVDVEQDTLEGQVLIELGIGILGAACGSEAEELRQDEEAVVQLLLSVGLGLVQGLADGICLLLLVALCQRLL